MRTHSNPLFEVIFLTLGSYVVVEIIKFVIFIVKSIQEMV